MSRDLVGSAPETPSADPRRADAPPSPPRVKRCPVCGRTFPRDERYYCSYHTAVLVEDAPPVPGADSPAAAKPQRRRALVALVLVAAVVCGFVAAVVSSFYVHRHRPRWASLLPTAQSGSVADDPHEVTAASVFGGDLAGRQVHLPPPEYPAAAKAQGVTGSVTVGVTLDGAGRVISARALDGPEALRAAAEGAALKARFKARASAGGTGTIRYDFMLCRDGGYCV